MTTVGTLPAVRLHRGVLPRWTPVALLAGAMLLTAGLFAVTALQGQAGFVVVAAVLFTPAVRRLGPDLRFWSASYAVYLLAVFFPQSSTFRLLVPLFPLLGAVAAPRSRVYRIGIVVACIVGQLLWLFACWWFNGYDWTPP